MQNILTWLTKQCFSSYSFYKGHFFLSLSFNLVNEQSTAVLSVARRKTSKLLHRPGISNAPSERIIARLDTILGNTINNHTKYSEREKEYLFIFDTSQPTPRSSKVYVRPVVQGHDYNASPSSVRRSLLKASRYCDIAFLMKVQSKEKSANLRRLKITGSTEFVGNSRRRSSPSEFPF